MGRRIVYNGGKGLLEHFSSLQESVSNVNLVSNITAFKKRVMPMRICNCNYYKHHMRNHSRNQSRKKHSTTITTAHIGKSLPATIN